MLILPLRTPHCAVILTLSTAKGKDLHVFFPSPPVSDRVVPIAPCVTDREPAEMKLETRLGLLQSLKIWLQRVTSRPFCRRLVLNSGTPTRNRITIDDFWASEIEWQGCLS